MISKGGIMNQKNKKYNIYDIAKELSLSPSTISKVLNGTGNISDATRDKVLSYIKKTGYTPNVAASALKKKSGYSIGILSPTSFYDIMSHQFFSKVLENLRPLIEEAGYEFTFVSHHLGPRYVSFKEYVEQRNIDGVIILGASAKDEDVLEVIETGIPAVSLDFVDERVPYVQTDDYDASMQIIDLIKRHHLEKLLYLGGDVTRADFEVRKRKFFKIINQEMIKCDLQNVKYSTVESAKETISKLIDEGKFNYDTIICGNDEIAFGAIHALNDHGYKVPAMVSVIGFDDMYFSKYFTPPLTTIAQNYRGLAESLSGNLFSYINGQDISYSNFVKGNLIERDSTR